MNAPVDVLAVQAETFALLLGFGERDAAMRLSDCTDATRELIEAAAEVRAAHRELPSAGHPPEIRRAGEARIGRAHFALESALIRVGGAA